VLHEPTSGATLTLPSDWTFATREGALVATSPSGNGFVLIAGAERKFETIRQDVAGLIATRLDDVAIATTQAAARNERGALEQIVVVRGTGTSRIDGQTVDFAGNLVQTGETGALVLGAWKDEAHATVVTKTLRSLRVRKTAGEKGLEITNMATGASVKIPAGWDVVRSRNGLLTTSPDRAATALLLPWQDNFEKTMEKVRGNLLTWALKDVVIGEFGVAEAEFHESLGTVLAATGTAVDRMDSTPVEFSVVRLQLADTDQGAAMIGIWKNAERSAELQRMIRSIRVRVPEARATEASHSKEEAEQKN
jgi:hypothetical protein